MKVTKLKHGIKCVECGGEASALYKCRFGQDALCSDCGEDYPTIQFSPFFPFDPHKSMTGYYLRMSSIFRELKPIYESMGLI
jgi:hypothetical protein